MSGFVPFTREALQRLRAGASAAELGWSESFYQRICREQGIQAYKPTTSWAPLPIGFRERIEAVLRGNWHETATRDIDILDLATNQIILLPELPILQCLIVVRLLLAQSIVGSDQIFRNSQYNYLHWRVSRAVKALNKTLAKTVITVESRSGPDGGYYINRRGTTGIAALRLVRLGDIAPIG